VSDEVHPNVVSGATGQRPKWGGVATQLAQMRQSRRAQAAGRYQPYAMVWRLKGRFS